ncbi:MULTISPECIES: hypothetical protein [unclassified Streptomyces]|uniref:hypothetical protein n=1 Tax=unclassified Streptomyces TaxID=2593676 RepID=UPI00364A3B27
MREDPCTDDGEGEAVGQRPVPAASRPSRRWWPLVGASRQVWWEGVRTVLGVVEAVAILTDAQALAVTARALAAVGGTVVDAGKPERP